MNTEKEFSGKTVPSADAFPSAHGIIPSGEKVRRYVDILSDAGFKAVFGEQRNSDVLIDLINVLLPPERKVMEISYMTTELPGFTPFSKSVRLDLRCRSHDGTVFIVDASCMPRRLTGHLHSVETGRSMPFRRYISSDCSAADSPVLPIQRTGAMIYGMTGIYPSTRSGKSCRAGYRMKQYFLFLQNWRGSASGWTSAGR